MSAKAKVLVALACALTACTAPGDLLSRDARPSLGGVLRARGPSYALDDVPRVVPPRGSTPTCSRDELVTYRGTHLRFDAAVSVHRAFPERLAKFEAIAREVGIEVYGRAPTTLHSGGAFACRTTASGRYLSEHALGNALDVAGFSFPAAGKKGALRVTVAKAWGEKATPEEKRFFSRLLERLRAEGDVFRAIIGPPDPSHHDHLHFDMGQWALARYRDPGS